MKQILLLLAFACLVLPVSAQMPRESIDTAMVRQIRTEGYTHSHAAQILEGLTDFCGSRLSWSPEFRAAAAWAEQQFSTMGLKNVHEETWTPAGKEWTLKHFEAHMTAPRIVPLIGVAKAWSPGTDGVVKGRAVYLDVKADTDFARYKGKLKKAFVFITEPKKMEINFLPYASRTPDSTLLKLANADAGDEMRQRRGPPPGDSTMMKRFMKEFRLAAQKIEFCQKEGAMVIIDETRGDGGTIMTGAASVPQPMSEPMNPLAKRINAYDENSPEILPQVTLAAEQYNRIVRLLQNGTEVQLEMNLAVSMSENAVPGANVIAEIPGTDLKDEVVMIGAHLDSWHPGTGAADNGTGVTTVMEAMRILSSIGCTPRRTIRVALWGGEEQGLHGSKGYVTAHFGERESTGPMPPPGMPSSGKLTTKPEYEKLAAYFNDDNGSGKFRGIYLQGNEAVRPIFRAWLAPFADLGASTIAAGNTGGTDHLSFDAIGLPGFQFIQDPLEYGRTYHTNFDVYERASEEDLKESAVIMASFAYDAAMRSEKLPHKPQAPAPSEPR